ncbi:MAG: zinc-binding dehydrogenase, partial [Candidatus Caldatribacteriaceae bacterium]
RRLGSCLGESVMVFGLGPIGLLVGVWARLAGARWLWGVEVDKKRVSLARNVGFDEVFHPWAIDAGKTPQVVVEASGNEKALLNSLSVVAKRGRLLLLGNQEKEVTLAPKDWSFILRKELTILGSWNSSFAHIFGDWEKVLTLEAQKRVSLLPFVSHRISLEEAPKFLEAMHQKTIAYTKVIIEP